MLRIGSVTKFYDKLLLYFLYFFGCWPKPGQSYLKTILCYLQILYAISYICCMLYSSFFVKNLYIRSNLVSLSIFATLVLVRVVTLNVSWKGVQGGLTKIQNFVLNDEDELLFIKNKMPLTTILSSSFFISHMFWVLGSMSIPFLLTERQLPLQANFPFDWKHNNFIYTVAYIYGSYGMALLSSMNALTSIYVCYIMFMISNQVEILSNRIQRLGGVNRFPNTSKNTEDVVNCINWHREIDMNLLNIENYFAFAFIGQIAFGGINICAGAFVLSQGSLTNEPVRYINCLYELCVSIIHILLPLYFGNEIILKMRDLTLAVYKSNWIDQSEEFRKMLVIFVENLKKPRIIYVGHVVPWDLETFTSILRFAYSLFNILQTMRA